MSFVIFNIDGGLGKCILGTAVCHAIAEQKPEKKLIVVSGYPEVFLNNPHVHRAYAFNNIQYFYDEYIRGKDSELFVHNPYNESDYVYKRKHLIEIWCQTFGLKYDERYLPRIYMTKREVDFYSRHMQADKPIFLVQTNGGAENQPVKYSWARDIPIHLAQKVVNWFSNDYKIIQIRREDQPSLENAQSYTAQFREIVVLMSLSSKRLLMDSYPHHLASALGLQSSVLWIVNSPIVFGYKFNHNILANPFTNKPELRGAYLQEFNIAGEPLEFPYNSEDEIFNLEVVMDSLLKNK